MDSKEAITYLRAKVSFKFCGYREIEPDVLSFLVRGIHHCRAGLCKILRLYFSKAKIVVLVAGGNWFVITTNSTKVVS